MKPLLRISRLGQQVVPSTIPARGMPHTCALGLISASCFKCTESERASLRTQPLFIRIFLSLCMSTLSLCLLFFPRVTTPARGKNVVIEPNQLLSLELSATSGQGRFWSDPQTYGCPRSHIKVTVPCHALHAANALCIYLEKSHFEKA